MEFGRVRLQSNYTKLYKRILNKQDETYEIPKDCLRNIEKNGYYKCSYEDKDYTFNATMNRKEISEPHINIHKVNKEANKIRRNIKSKTSLIETTKKIINDSDNKEDNENYMKVDDTGKVKTAEKKNELINADSSKLNDFKLPKLKIKNNKSRTNKGNNYIDSHTAFYHKYLRHVVLRKLNPKLRKQYEEFALASNQPIMGKDFLKRMNHDIEKRNKKEL